MRYLLVLLVPLFCFGRDFDEKIRLSGQVVYFSEGSGILPGGVDYYPGYRLGVDRKGLLDLGASYLRWEGKRERHFKMPILQKRKEVEGRSELDFVELTLGKEIFVLRDYSIAPYGGIEWNSRRDFLTIDQKLLVRNEALSWGPLAGVRARAMLGEAFEIYAGGSLSYMGVDYMRLVRDGINLKKGFHEEKSRVYFGGLYKIGLGRGNFRICGGYEMHHFWSKGDLPDHLHGFTGELGLDF